MWSSSCCGLRGLLLAVDRVFLWRALDSLSAASGCWICLFSSVRWAWSLAVLLILCFPWGVCFLLVGHLLSAALLVLRFSFCASRSFLGWVWLGLDVLCLCPACALPALLCLTCPAVPAFKHVPVLPCCALLCLAVPAFKHVPALLPDVVAVPALPVLFCLPCLP